VDAQLALIEADFSQTTERGSRSNNCWFPLARSAVLRVRCSVERIGIVAKYGLAPIAAGHDMINAPAYLVRIPLAISAIQSHHTRCQDLLTNPYFSPRHLKTDKTQSQVVCTF
jgi:hypothetical protein